MCIPELCSSVIWSAGRLEQLLPTDHQQQTRPMIVSCVLMGWMAGMLQLRHGLQMVWQDRTGQSDERERRQQSTCSFLLRVGKWPDSLTRAKWGAGQGASGGGELSAQALEPGCREPHPVLTWRDRRQCKSFPQTVMQRGWVTMRFVKISTSYSVLWMVRYF